MKCPQKVEMGLLHRLLSIFWTERIQREDSFCPKNSPYFGLTKVQLLNLCPLTGNRQGELAVRIGPDRRRGIVAQVV